MWTATLLKFNTDQGRVDIAVEYTDGTDTHVRTYNLQNPTKKSIRDLVRAEANRFEAVKVEVIDLEVGLSIDIIPDVVVPPPAPTSEEIAERAWFDDWRQLKQLIELTTAVPALETAQATTLIASLKASLEADWLNSCLGKI